MRRQVQQGIDRIQREVAGRVARVIDRAGPARQQALALSVGVGITLERSVRSAVPIRRGREAVTWREDGEGPAIVFVNGWTLSGRVWPATLIDELARDHRVVRIDNRGTGDRRRGQAPFTIAAMADDVARVIERAELEAPTVVGFSMGGMISMELALRSPELVASLVLVGTRPPCAAHTDPAPAVLARAFSLSGVKRTAEYFVTRWGTVAGAGFAERRPDRLAEMADQALNQVTPRSMILTQARAVGAWRRPERLRQIAAPCLVIHGSDDPLSPPSNGRRIAEVIPGARHVELDGVGHLVPQEAAEELAALVRSAVR